MDEERQETPDDGANEPAGEDVSKDGVEDASDTTAPSIGPNTIIDRSDEKTAEEVREESPEDPETGMREVDLDAMGNDKRRQVVGKSYGASIGKQVAIYAVFVAAVIALAIGANALIASADKGHNPSPPEAPWAQPGAPQHPPKPLQ